MPRLKRISGKEIVSFCENYGFCVGRQKGSHINLIRQTKNGKQVATIPNHKEIDRGTLHTIFKQLARFIPEANLREFFYTK